MIELRHVSKVYQLGSQKLTALQDMHLQIKEGEVVALMGPSGCGKSTTLNIIGLLDRPTTGEYLLQQRLMLTLANNELAVLRNQTIGFVFQAFFLLPRLTAVQNVGLPLLYRGLGHRVIEQRALASMERVGIAELAMRQINEISGGQQQRVAIARALVGGPKIILADEPTGSLDSHTGQEVMNLLLTLNQQEKVTLVITTHNKEVAKYCGRIINMRDGRVV